MNGCGVNHGLNGIADIGSALAIIDFCPSFFEGICQRTFFGVGTGNLKSLFQKDFGQTAHTDAADPDKMNSDGFVKIYLIHMRISLVFYFVLLKTIHICYMLCDRYINMYIFIIPPSG